MAELSVGFVDDGERAMVTIQTCGTTFTIDANTAKWLADDLEIWATRVEATNKERKNNDE